MLIDCGGAGADHALVIAEAVLELRRRQMPTLSGAAGQERAVAALARLATCWRDPGFVFRRDAERLTEPFPFSMVWPTLDALLDSLSAENLWALIDGDGVRDALGYPVIGHISAGNTPLLPWTTIIRALLVRSASAVKLSSRIGGDWAELFHRSLEFVDPGLADCVALMTWPGGSELDAVLCRSVDAVAAYGSDAALASLRAHCPASTPFIGYGHRVSFGLVPTGSYSNEALCGFAADTLTFDQGGCLSPQTIFVEGKWNDARAFAEAFAEVLADAARDVPKPNRPLYAAAAVRNARSLARMSSDNVVWAGERLRWTVVARNTPLFEASPTYCVISVQPLASVGSLEGAIDPVRGFLQGCAVAARSGELSIPEDLERYLTGLGVSFVCRPGQLQRPPLSWRQDNRPVLASFAGWAP